MARIEVQPRDTPAERDDRVIEVDVDEDLSVHAQIIEDWTAPRQSWDFYLREGHDFGRPNNVEGHVAFVAGEQTSTLTFRLDQLDAADDFGEELLLIFEERDGIAKTVRLTPNGLEVQLFHILTYT
jgi:hypothetical protein